MSYLERDRFGRMNLKGNLTDIQTPFGERGSIDGQTHQLRVPSVPTEMHDIKSAPPIASQRVMSTGVPNVPAVYVRPPHWPRDRRIADLPSTASAGVAGPERSVLPQTMSIIMGEQGSRSSEDVSMKLAAEKAVETQRLAAKQSAAQRAQKAKMSGGRANHRWGFGQINIPFIADLQVMARSRIASLQERLERFRTPPNGTTPQRMRAQEPQRLGERLTSRIDAIRQRVSAGRV